GQAQEFVVIDLYDKGDAVRIFAGHDVEDAKCRSDGVATGFNRQFDDILWIEIDRVGGEGRGGTVFDPLVDRENGQIAGVGEPSMAEHRLQSSQYLIVATGIHPNLFHVVGRRESADGRLINDRLMVE